MSNATKLPNSVREENYRRQNTAGHGKNALSNRQMRRLKRHDNLQKIQQVAAATFKDEPVYDAVADEVMDFIGDGSVSEPTPEEETAAILSDAETMDALKEAEEEKRPCGGTDYCVTPSGKKTKTHKKCEASV